MLNVIGNGKIFLAISVVVVAAAIVVIAVFGFRQGIDFSGGTLWRFSIGEGKTAEELRSVLVEITKSEDVRVVESGEGGFLVRLPALSEPDHQAFSQELITRFPEFEESSFQSIGPSIGRELRNRSFIAIALVLLGISLYIAFAFRKVYRPVSSWTYGWITLITLFHDVVIPAGLLAILGHYGRVEIDSNFVVALLVVMGFSVHDTIVVFDRIRENLVLDKGRVEFTEVVNTSVNQTIARSVNTSLTLILVLLALYVSGPAALQYFVITLLVGVSIGIYSSVFVASPLLVFARRVIPSTP